MEQFILYFAYNEAEHNTYSSLVSLTHYNNDNFAWFIRLKIRILAFCISLVELYAYYGPIWIQISYRARTLTFFIHKTGGSLERALWLPPASAVTRRGPAAAGRTSTCWPAAGADLWGCVAAGRPCWSAGWRCCCTAVAAAAAGAVKSRPASASTRSAATGRSRGWRR